MIATVSDRHPLRGTRRGIGSVRPDNPTWCYVSAGDLAGLYRHGALVKGWDGGDAVYDWQWILDQIGQSYTTAAADRNAHSGRLPKTLAQTTTTTPTPDRGLLFVELSEDWYAIYNDGDYIEQGHPLDPDDLLVVLTRRAGVEHGCEVRYAQSDLLMDGGMPAELRDVPILRI